MRPCVPRYGEGFMIKQISFDNAWVEIGHFGVSIGHPRSTGRIGQWAEFWPSTPEESSLMANALREAADAIESIGNRTDHTLAL